VVLASWSYSMVLAVIAASVVILTAGYILWTIQRVYLGPEYKGPHAEGITPMNKREIAIAVPLVVLAIVLGVFPRVMLDYSTPSTNKVADDLTAWKMKADRAAADLRRVDGGASQQSSPKLQYMPARTTYSPPHGMKEITTPEDVPIQGRPEVHVQVLTLPPGTIEIKPPKEFPSP
jgi:hypothetical protein